MPGGAISPSSDSTASEQHYQHILTNAPVGTHQVTVTPAGGAQVGFTLAPISFTVSALPTPPAITAQPQSTNVAPGGTVTLTVTASGTGPLRYQWWRFNGTQVQVFDSARISGSATNVLTITDVTNNDAGTYSVRISNSAGVATLTVSP